MKALLIKIAAALLLSLTLAGMAVGLYEQRQLLTLTRTQLDEQTATVASLRASHAKTAASIVVLQRTSAETSRVVRAALDTQPEFRDTPVPRSVADGLCGRLHCAP